MNRTRAYYRHQRDRVIKRKVYILTQIIGNDLKNVVDGVEVTLPLGRYSKGKVHCSCKMCKYEKHYKLEKHKIKEKKRLMEKEIRSYL